MLIAGFGNPGLDMEYVHGFLAAWLVKREGIVAESSKASPHFMFCRLFDDAGAIRAESSVRTRLPQRLL